MTLKCVLRQEIACYDVGVSKYWKKKYKMTLDYLSVINQSAQSRHVTLVICVTLVFLLVVS